MTIKASLKYVVFGIVFMVLESCGKNPETLLPHLSGYWEIESVTLADGSKKQYSFSNSIDYIEINDSLMGFRKKLKPNLMGEFKASNDNEQIKAAIEGDSLNLYYSTEFDQWKETVLNANEKQLVIKNTDNNIYTYKRYKPLEIE